MCAWLAFHVCFCEPNRKGRPEAACCIDREREFFFFAPYYQDTKSSYETRQISLRTLWWKCLGIRGRYFGEEVRGLTISNDGSVSGGLCRLSAGHPKTLLPAPRQCTTSGGSVLGCKIRRAPALGKETTRHALRLFRRLVRRSAPAPGRDRLHARLSYGNHCNRSPGQRRHR